MSSTTAPMAMRCQAMSSGPRSVRSATILPLTPEVPQHSAARTTSRNPRREAGEARGEDMTLLDRFRVGDSDPEHGAAAGQASIPASGAGQPAALRVRSGAGAVEGPRPPHPSQARGEPRDGALASWAGSVAGAPRGPLPLSSTVDARPLVWRHPVNLPRAGRQQG